MRRSRPSLTTARLPAARPMAGGRRRRCDPARRSAGEPAAQVPPPPARGRPGRGRIGVLGAPLLALSCVPMNAEQLLLHARSELPVDAFRLEAEHSGTRRTVTWPEDQRAAEQTVGMLPAGSLEAPVELRLAGLRGGVEVARTSLSLPAFPAAALSHVYLCLSPACAACTEGQQCSPTGCLPGEGPAQDTPAADWCTRGKDDPPPERDPGDAGITPPPPNEDGGAPARDDGGATTDGGEPAPRGELLLPLLSGGEVELESLLSDGTGGALLAGHYTGTLQMGSQQLPAAEGWDAFLARVDGDGQPRWVRHLGGPGEQEVTALARSGEFLLVGGAFAQTLEVEAHRIYTASDADRHGFVLRFAWREGVRLDDVALLQPSRVTALAIGSGLLVAGNAGDGFDDNRCPTPTEVGNLDQPGLGGVLGFALELDPLDLSCRGQYLVQLGRAGAGVSAATAHPGRGDRYYLAGAYRGRPGGFPAGREIDVFALELLGARLSAGEVLRLGTPGDDVPPRSLAAGADGRLLVPFGPGSAPVTAGAQTLPTDTTLYAAELEPSLGDAVRLFTLPASPDGALLGRAAAYDRDDQAVIAGEVRGVVLLPGQPAIGSGPGGGLDLFWTGAAGRIRSLPAPGNDRLRSLAQQGEERWMAADVDGAFTAFGGSVVGNGRRQGVVLRVAP